MKRVGGEHRVEVLNTRVNVGSGIDGIVGTEGCYGVGSGLLKWGGRDNHGIGVG